MFNWMFLIYLIFLIIQIKKSLLLSYTVLCLAILTEVLLDIGSDRTMLLLIWVGVSRNTVVQCLVLITIF